MAKDGRLTEFCATAERIQRWCLAFMLATLFADLMAQILSRFVFRIPLIWTEEVSRLAMIWMVFLGAALAVRRHAHFAVEFLVQSLPGGYRRLAQGAIFLSLMVVSAIFLVEGIFFARMGMDVVSPTVDIRMIWSYLAVPTGGLFMGLYSLERLLAILRGEERL
jgi:TRAP-type C4-dicarboxylate transport system permease small subunit